MHQSVQFMISVAVLLVVVFGSTYFVELKKHSEIFIPNVDPFKVFMIFGNFTNFFLLEPNLICFKLQAEYDGSKMINISITKYDEFVTNHRDRLLSSNQTWSYDVWYEEYYQYLPAILTNKNQGQYILSRRSKNLLSTNINQEENLVIDNIPNTNFEEEYEVISNHKTEFLPGHPINTRAVNIFKSVTMGDISKEKGTLVIEDVYYESPLLFIPLAFAEVEAQRSKVLNTLANWKYN